MDKTKSVGQKFGDGLDNVPVLGKVIRRWSMSNNHIRRETFTRWCNYALESHGIMVADITKEIPDGKTVVHLYEALSKEELRDVTREPSTEEEKKKNIDLVIQAMDYHSIPCDKIDVRSLLQGNLATILELLWHLFLRFELDIPMGGQNLSTELPKLVLIWLQSVIGTQTVQNLSTDWCDGLALAKLVNTLSSDLMDDSEFLLAENAEYNLEKTMKAAQESFGIPILLNPRDLANNHIDEQCMVAYFSYYMREHSIGEDWTVRMLNTLNPDIEITTLARNLNLGILFHRLVTKIVPVERAKNSENGTNLARIQFSMDVAKQCLGVEKVIQAEDFQNPSLPRLELISYLSQFNGTRKKRKSISSFFRSGNISESSSLIRVNGELDKDFCSSQESRNSSTLEMSGPYTSPEPGTYVIKLFDNIKLDTRFPSMDSISKDLTSITISGDGLKEGIVNKTSSFVVHKNGSHGKLEISVEDPLGIISSAKLMEEDNGKVTATYVPRHTGLYRIYIFVDGLQIEGCPHEVYAVQNEEVAVNLPEPASDGNRYGSVEEDYEVRINSKSDNVQDLKAFICREKGEQREISVHQVGENEFVTIINVTDIGEYELFIYFRNILLSDFPLLIVFNNPALCVAHGTGLLRGVVSEPCEFEIDARDAGSGILNISINNAENVVVDVLEIDTNHYHVSYVPNHSGILSISLFYSGVPIRGSPFSVKIVDPASFVLSPSGTTTVAIGDEAAIEMEVKDQSAKDDLKFVITGPAGEIDGKLYSIDEERVNLLFVPETTGIYKVEMFIDEYAIKGTPFFVEVKGQECYPHLVLVTESSNRAILDSANRITVDASNGGEGELTVEAHGHEKEVVLGYKMTKKGIYSITYYPQEASPFQLSIKWNGEHIKGSPFTIEVEEILKEATYGASKVILYGSGLEEAVKDKVNIIHINAKEAGRGKLHVYEVGENTHVFYGVKDNEDGTFTITYVPNIVGQITLGISWDGQQVPGSPVDITVKEAPKISSPTVIKLSGNGIEKAYTGKENIIRAEISGEEKPEIVVLVVGSQGPIPVETEKFKDGVLEMRYTPEEEGPLSITIKQNNKPLKGFPREIQAVKAPDEVKRPDVVPMDVPRPTIIRLSGSGIQQAVVNQENVIIANTTGRDRPEITAIIVGSNGPLPVRKEQIDDGITEMRYIPVEEGILSITIKQNNQPLKGFPKEVEAKIATDDVDGQNQDLMEQVVIKLSGAGLEKAFTGEDNIIRAEISGRGTAEVTATIVASHGQLPVKTEKIKDHVLELRYVPIEEGPLSITVKQNNEPLQGFPREIQAKRRFVVVDARKVEILDGVDKDGHLNFPIALKLDTSKTGNSELTCICTNPSGVKTAGLFKKEEDGRYVVDLLLTENGMHSVNIYWGGSPIRGSPFPVNVQQKIDPGKVKVYGEGLRDGVLGEYEGKFYVQTKDAGPGTLTVRVNGPEGAFRVNIKPVNKTERIVCVTYGPKEEGIYIIRVCWSDHDVPDSPFTVNIKSKEVANEPRQLRRVVTYYEPTPKDEKKEKRKKSFSFIRKKKKKPGKATFVEIDDVGENATDASDPESRRASAVSSSSGSQGGEVWEQGADTSSMSTDKLNSISSEDLEDIPES